MRQSGDAVDISRSGILYLIFTLASLPSPALVAKLGVKTSLVLASVPYLLNILQLFTLNPGYIYFMAGEKRGVGDPGVK